MQDRSLSNIGPNFIFSEKWGCVVYSLISPQRRYKASSWPTILTSGTLVNELGTFHCTEIFSPAEVQIGPNFDLRYPK